MISRPVRLNRPAPCCAGQIPVAARLLSKDEVPGFPSEGYALWAHSAALQQIPSPPILGQKPLHNTATLLSMAVFLCSRQERETFVRHLDA